MLKATQEKKQHPQYLEYLERFESTLTGMSVVLKSVLNAYYSKELSHKIRATIYLKMQRKERLGMAPFGYVLDESRTQYLIDPEAAQTVRLIFQLAIQKKGTTEIADYLNANHIPTIAEYYRERPELGKSHFPLAEHPQWDSTKVWHLLRDKAYMGTLILRKSTVIVPASKKTRQTDEYRAQKEALTREGKAVSSRLSQLREQKSALEGGILPSEMMKLTEAARQYQYATALSRDMVTAFVDAILVYEDHVEIQWKFQDIWAALEHPQAEFKNEEVTSLGTEEAENKENP